MKKLPVYLKILELRLKNYYQKKYPKYNVDFKCEITQHEGRTDWDGYIDYYYNIESQLTLSTILVFDGYEQELIDKKSISQKQLLKDVKTIYNEYFAENNMNLVVSDITVYDDCIMIKPIEKEKDKQLILK